MAAFNPNHHRRPNFLLLISLTSLLVLTSSTFATTDNVVSAPSASPASAPSSSSANVGEVNGLLETTVTEPTQDPPVNKEMQAKIGKAVESTVMGVKAGADQFVQEVIATKLSDPTTDAQTRECLTQCKENYASADDDINKVIEDISAGDYYKAMVDVEGVSTFVDTCYDCLNEMVGEEPQFKKFDDWVKEVTGDCLEQLSKINS